MSDLTAEFLLPTGPIRVVVGTDPDVPALRVHVQTSVDDWVKLMAIVPTVVVAEAPADDLAWLVLRSVQKYFPSAAPNDAATEFHRRLHEWLLMERSAIIAATPSAGRTLRLLQKIRSIYARGRATRPRKRG